MAIPPVSIDFVVRRTGDVSRAFRSVADAVARGSKASGDDAGERARLANRLRSVKADFDARRAAGAKQVSDAKRAADAAAREDIRAANAAASERRRIAQRLATEERRIRAEIARDKAANGGEVSGRSAGAIKRLGILESVKSAPTANMHAALEKVTSMRMLQAAQRQGEQDANRLSNAQSRAAERAARAQMRATRLAEQEEARARAKGLREEDAAARRKDAIRTRSALMAGRLAAKQAAEEQRHAEQRRKLFASSVVGGARNATGALISGGVGLARTALQLGGGFSIQDALGSKMQLERRAALLSTKATDPSDRMSGAQISDRVKAASSSTKVDEEKLLSAWEAYADKTGDFKGGAENMEFFGKLSKATGADIEQVAKTAGLLRVQNKDLGPEQMKTMLMNVVAQGRSGAVDFGELAGHAAEITKTSTAFAGEQADTQRRLLALSQVGVRTGSVSEAATMIANISGDASKHRDEVAELLGKDTFNDKGQIASSPEQFLADIIAKTGGNRQKIMDLGFGQRSVKLFDALLPTYNAEEKKALQGGATKEEATRRAREKVLADMGQFTDAKYTDKELDRDFATVMSTSAEQFEDAVRQLKREVGDKLVPALVPLIQVLKDATPQVGKLLTAFVGLVQWAQANPFAAAFAGLGVSIGKEFGIAIGNAGLAKILESSIGKQLGAVGAAGFVITTAYLTVQQLKQQDDQQQNDAFAATVGAAQAQARLRRGDASSADVTAAQAEQAKLETSIKQIEQNKGGNAWFQRAAYAGALVTDATTWGSAGATKRVKAAETERRAADEQQLTDLKKQLSGLASDIATARKSINNTQPAIADSTNESRRGPMSSAGRTGGNANNN